MYNIHIHSILPIQCIRILYTYIHNITGVGWSLLLLLLVLLHDLSRLDWSGGLVHFSKSLY